MDKEHLGSVVEILRDDMIDAHAEMTVSTEHLRAVLEALEAALARAEGAERKVTTLRGALSNCVEWEAIMGGFDSPCWSTARAALEALEAALARAEGAEEERNLFRKEAASLAKDAVAAGWQPIETAPRIPGRHVLLYGDGPGFVECAIVGYWCDDFKDPSEWVTMEGSPSVKATHWMPLPAAPEPRP